MLLLFVIPTTFCNFKNILIKLKSCNLESVVSYLLKMSKRKVVKEVASGSGDGKLHIDETFLNNLTGNTEYDGKGKLELGPTMLDIREGLKIVSEKKDGEKLFKYTIMLYICRGGINAAVQFLEIESHLPIKEIREVFFKHMKYSLPDNEKIHKRVGKKCKYFGEEVGDLFYIALSIGHAYIYIAESDGKKYDNSLSGSLDFIYRTDPENRPSLCSIM